MKKATIEQHIEAGNNLKELNELLVKTLVLIAGSNGKTKVRKQINRIDRAIHEIQEVKNELENLMYKENPDIDNLLDRAKFRNGGIDVYYGERFSEVKRSLNSPAGGI